MGEAVTGHRWLVFAGAAPGRGGWADFRGSAASATRAKSLIRPGDSWAELVDLATRAVVLRWHAGAWSPADGG